MKRLDMKQLIKNRSVFVAILVFALVASIPASTLAQGRTGGSIGVQGGKYGLGFTSSWPAYGLSGTYQKNEEITLEAVIGFLGTVNSYSGRLWYRFKPGAKADIYAVGGAGVYVYDYGLLSRRESVLGLQAGVGVESGIQALVEDPELPPIFFNFEISLGYANFEFYDFSALSFGVGLHYRFGR